LNTLWLLVEAGVAVTTMVAVAVLVVILPDH
jgi:hypothetical protein